MCTNYWFTANANFIHQTIFIVYLEAIQINFSK